jgi:serine/threonine protein kinase
MDRYLVERRCLGNGRFGRIYAATDRETNAPVVLKRIFIPAADADGLPHAVLRELSVWTAISSDAGAQRLVPLMEVFTHRSCVVMVAPRYECDVLTYLRREHHLHSRRLPESAAVAILRGILQGLVALHSQSIVHRDLKPSNAFMASDGSAVVGDFGLARFLPDAILGATADGSLTHEVVSRHYRAPELLLGTTRYGCEVDMWAFACFAVEVLDGVGTVLFPGSNDIDQLGRIFALLGTPTSPGWVDETADWGKVQFVDTRVVFDCAALLPHCSLAAQAFVVSVLQLDPKLRPTAQQCLDHILFPS